MFKKKPKQKKTLDKKIRRGQERTYKPTVIKPSGVYNREGKESWCKIWWMFCTWYFLKSAFDLRNDFRLPDNMTMEDGSLLEPLCVAIHGVRKSGAKVGKKMLVLGAGYFWLSRIMRAHINPEILISSLRDQNATIFMQLATAWLQTNWRDCFLLQQKCIEILLILLLRRFLEVDIYLSKF